MSLTIKYIDIAKTEADVDIASYFSDENYLHIEFAKIMSENSESGEIEEIEVRSKLRLPIKDALGTFGEFLRVLIEHEKTFKDGNGLSFPKIEETE